MDRYTITDKSQTKTLIKAFSQSPGVYIFKDQKGTVLYVGKAKNLQKRLRQYFERDDAVGEKTKLLVPQIRHIETIQTISEFDALLLEARLIHDYNPKYNSIAKDDKSPLYIALTLDESLPRVLFVRKPTRERVSKKRKFFGPFQSSRTARMVLRQLRRIAPYCSQKKRDGAPCFYTHLGLCDPCASVIAAMPDTDQRDALTRQYRKNIMRLHSMLSGKATTILTDLTHEMNAYAASQQFERATTCRNQIEQLQELLRVSYNPYLYMENATFLEHMVGSELSKLQEVLLPYYPHVTALKRIECIDVSNILGSHATGSLVVFSDGRPDTSQYRRFHIRDMTTPNDVAMIQQVIERRFTHTEWPYPDLLVVDGGKPQSQIAIDTLTILGISIPVIGLAKRNEEIVVPAQGSFKTIRLPYAHTALQLIQRMRDEAHRFALSYHRTLRRKAFV
jgi:excinuclease ABC subunit C